MKITIDKSDRRRGDRYYAIADAAYRLAVRRTIRHLINENRRLRNYGPNGIRRQR